MLTYQETIWKKENGFKIRKVQLHIKSIQALETIKDQKRDRKTITSCVSEQETKENSHRKLVSDIISINLGQLSNYLEHRNSIN